MLFCKTLELVDYQRFDRSIQHIKNMQSVMSGVPVRFEHPHRTWEYGLTLEALRQNGAKTVLDVGGGGSLFAPAATWIGMEVRQVDPGDHGEAITQQSKHLGKILGFVQMDFMDYPLPPNNQYCYDAVTCLSVIEHVPDDTLFFAKLAEHVRPGGLLCLTTDFHPSGEAVSAGHLRSYNAQNMHEWIKLADPIFEMTPFGDTPDYEYFEPFVYDYTFAALVLKKNK